MKFPEANETGQQAFRPVLGFSSSQSPFLVSPPGEHLTMELKYTVEQLE
jgi:hypothetical protein